LPDLRGRTVVGKDDMGGTAANRVTAGISGIAGITLGATGGSEAVHQHSHTNTASFTGSAVTSGAGSAHTHVQNAHTHTDAGHTHYTWGGAFSGSTQYVSTWDGAGQQRESNTGYASISSTTATNQNESAHTHSVTAAGTVTMTNANFGSGSSQNMQPSIILNYIIKY
jgi:microcystin-dependent protein